MPVCPYCPRMFSVPFIEFAEEPISGVYLSNQDYPALIPTETTHLPVGELLPVDTAPQVIPSSGFIVPMLSAAFRSPSTKK